MMRKLNFFFLFSFMILAYCTPSAQSDPMVALAQAEVKWQETKGYHCILAVTMREGAEPVLGNFFADKGRYHMDFEEDETICDMETTMVWLKTFGNATFDPYVADNDMSLGGMYALYRNHHSVVFEKEENGMRKYVLTDQNPGTRFATKIIWIGRESGLIEKFILQSAQYGSFSYEIEDAQTGLELDERLFTPSERFYAAVLAGDIPVLEHESHDHDHGADGHDHDHDHGAEGLKHWYDFW